MRAQGVASEPVGLVYDLSAWEQNYDPLGVNLKHL